LDTLALIGLTFPDTPAEIKTAIGAAHREVQALLAGKRIADLADAPEATDAVARETILLITEAGPPFYFGRPALYPLIHLASMRLSLQHGNTPESPNAYCSYGVLLAGPLAEDYAGAFEFAQVALRLNETIGNAKLRG